MVFRASLGSVAALALCGAAACAQPVEPIARVAPGPEQMPLDLGWERGVFLVDLPGAPRSTASRLGDDLASKDGVVPPPSGGYLVTADVIVVARSDAWIQAAGASAQALHGLDGVWTVPAPSVTAAAALASSLRRLDDIESAYLNAAPPTEQRSEVSYENIRAATDADPLESRQWTHDNTTYPTADARITKAWAMGVTGQGVTIGLLDAPIDSKHPDLAPNFDAERSTQAVDAVPDAHSTAVAGIAAAARNGVGMVGAAPQARLASLPATTTIERIEALLEPADTVRIRLGTVGRSDRYRVSHLDPATDRALTMAADRSVIVWAAGNGGPSDRMDHDAIASHPAVMPITAVGDLDLRANFGEKGSAQLVSAHAGGNARGVVATLPGGEWTTRFGGTSAAAPLAAGAIALALEANPALSPREIECLLVRTARVLDERSGVWQTNAAGTRFSELHGFGAVDAQALVRAAKEGHVIAPARRWSSGAIGVWEPLSDPLKPTDPLAWHTVEVQATETLSVEHAVVELHVRTEFVGDLIIELVSPAGTVSTLASPRPDPQDDLRGRRFLSRKHWGEASAGVWRVRIADAQPGDEAMWERVELRLRGTQRINASTEP